MHGVRDSRESMLLGQLDDNDDDHDEYKQSTLGVVNILLSETKRNIEKNAANIMVKCVLIYSQTPLTVSFFSILTDKQKLKIDFKIVTAIILNRIIENFSVL